MIERARAMRRLLEEGLRCGCLGLEECVLFSGDLSGSVHPGPAGSEGREV